MLIKNIKTFRIKDLELLLASEDKIQTSITKDFLLVGLIILARPKEKLRKTMNICH
jgi:hypothetical protein